MTFEIAKVTERGIKFVIITVEYELLTKDASIIKTERDNLKEYFPGLPIIFMSKDSLGAPTYNGRKDIVKFLPKISPVRINWESYTI